MVLAYLGLYLMGFGTSFLVSKSHGILALLIIGLLSAYNHLFKGVTLMGNVIIALLCGLPLYYAEWPQAIDQTLVPVIFAVVSTLAREIIKDNQDMEGDKKAGRHTLPITYGVPLAKKTAAILLVIIFLSLPFPVLLFNYHMSFSVCALLLVALPLFKAFLELLKPSPQWELAQKMLKIMMLGGLVSLVAGKLM